MTQELKQIPDLEQMRDDLQELYDIIKENIQDNDMQTSASSRLFRLAGYIEDFTGQTIFKRQW